LYAIYTYSNEMDKDMNVCPTNAQTHKAMASITSNISLLMVRIGYTTSCRPIRDLHDWGQMPEVL